MKYRIFFIAIVVCFATCASAQPYAVKVRQLLDHHFIGGQNIALKKGINYFIITNRKQYEKFFGTTNRADTPQFAKELMLVMLMPSSKSESRLIFKNADTKAGNFVEVYCDINTNVGTATYTAYPIAACAIPKYPGMAKMNFYDQRMRLLASVPVKN